MLHGMWSKLHLLSTVQLGYLVKPNTYCIICEYKFPFTVPNMGTHLTQDEMLPLFPVLFTRSNVWPAQVNFSFIM